MMVIPFRAAAAAAVMAASTAIAETGVRDRYVGPWHVGVRTNPGTGGLDHVASVDDGDYRLAFRCIGGKSSVVFFSRGQTPPFEEGATLDVIARADEAVPRTGQARAIQADAVTIGEGVVSFGDIADARVVRIRMRSDAGDRIDAAFDVSQARGAMADVVRQCPDGTK